MSTLMFSSLDFQNGPQKVTGLPTPSAASDAATKAYVDTAAEGINWKDSVRVSTQGDINLASPGATIDGITLVAGDRILVRSQTAAAQNGIYIWNGAAVAATRAPDADTADELEAATTTVEEGTDAGATFRQTSVNFVLDTGDVTWTSFGTATPDANETTRGKMEVATQAEVDAGTLDSPYAVTPLKLANWSGRKRKHAATFGDGAATQFDFTHNFGTVDVLAKVFRNSDNADVGVDIRRVDGNTVRVNVETAPASNALRVVILG